MRGLIMLGLAALVTAASAGETLYNGIVLPDAWPPKIETLSRAPLATPPYLLSPPAVIPIDVGRQLFVDDFLVEQTDLARTHHQAEYHTLNPVLKPEKWWEGTEKGARRTGAGVFSDGVWYDPADKLFKMFYWGGSVPKKPEETEEPPLGYYTCLAISRDGINWEKPDLGVVPGTNIVLVDERGFRRNSNSVWLDLEEKDPTRRFKMFCNSGREEGVENALRFQHRLRLYHSPDGIHWTLDGDSDPCGDRTSCFYNALRKVWIFGLRDGDTEVSRCRAYFENRDWLKGAHWLDSKGNKPKAYWLGADELDADRKDLVLRRVPERPWDLVPSQLYNLDCNAYESVLLGCFSIWRGHPLDGRPKINELCVGFSRDGFHWARPDRRAFAGVSEKKEDWNWGNVQSAGGCCLVVGDKLYFYVTAANRPAGWATGLDATYTGLATLRRDGFTSLDAGDRAGTITTRPLTFKGKYLFVNVNAPQGELRAEVLDEKGQPIKPFTRENCQPLRIDSTLAQVQWKGASDLSKLAGKPVRLRFSLKNGSLYSFWVSPDKSGASYGYVAAGGPGFTSARDTVGKAAE
jgi:hypothetical protein